MNLYELDDDDACFQFLLKRSIITHDSYESAIDYDKKKLFKQYITRGAHM